MIVVGGLKASTITVNTFCVAKVNGQERIAGGVFSVSVSLSVFPPRVSFGDGVLAVVVPPDVFSQHRWWVLLSLSLDRKN